MNRRIFLSIVIGVVLRAMPCAALEFASSKDVGGRPDAFLDYAVSARSLGMGRAYSGIADDASATYWNPAGLAQLLKQDLVTAYSVLPEQTGLGFLSYAHPTSAVGTLGVSAASLRSSGFTRRDELGQDTGTFDQSTLALFISDGITVRDRLAVGGTAKAVRQQVDTFSAMGYGLDAGVLIKMAASWQAGLSIHNLIAPRLTLRSDADQYPRDMRLGLKFQPIRQVVLGSDVMKAENLPAALRFGVDWLVSDILAIRTGINESELTAGIGVNVGTWGLDYAFGYQQAVHDAQDVGGIHRIGFHVSFGAPAPQFSAPIVLVEPDKTPIKNAQFSTKKKTASAPAAPKKMDIDPVLAELDLAQEKIGWGAINEAINHLQKVGALYPPASEVEDCLNRATSLLKEGAEPASGSDADINRDVALSLILYSKGLILRDNGRVNEAVTAWNESLKYVPENHLAKEAINQANLRNKKK